jgi:MOSC domain-containing protein YiiM
MSSLAFEGRLLAICLAAEPAAPMCNVDEVDAIAGVGLSGDRYALQTGTFQRQPASHPQDVTLIEQESLDAALRDQQTAIEHTATRRNLLTQGVPLNHLVGKTFQIGDVLIRGIELCEPCRHLQKLTFKEILKPLIHRGGLRAEILRGGKLQVGMRVLPV